MRRGSLRGFVGILFDARAADGHRQLSLLHGLGVLHDHFVLHLGAGELGAAGECERAAAGHALAVAGGTHFVGITCTLDHFDSFRNSLGVRIVLYYRLADGLVSHEVERNCTGRTRCTRDHHYDEVLLAQHVECGK